MWIPWLQYEIDGSCVGNGKRQCRRTGSLNHSRRYACRFFWALICIGYCRFYRVMSPPITHMRTRETIAVWAAAARCVASCVPFRFSCRVYFMMPLPVLYQSLGLWGFGSLGSLVFCTAFSFGIAVMGLISYKHCLLPEN